jgi:hypothetical protein
MKAVDEPVRDGFVLCDPDGVLHLSASVEGIKITWCENRDFIDLGGQYWHSKELYLERGVPTCIRCVGQ